MPALICDKSYGIILLNKIEQLNTTGWMCTYIDIPMIFQELEYLKAT